MNREFKLRAEYVGFYPKYNEERQQSYDVFKYAVSGSPEAIAEFKRITQEKGYKVNTTDDGRPIHFTLDYAGPNAEVKITTGGAIVINDEMQRQIQSLVGKSKGLIQEKLAEQGAQMLLGKLFGSKASAVNPVGSTEESEETETSASPEEVDFDSENSEETAE